MSLRPILGCMILTFGMFELAGAAITVDEAAMLGTKLTPMGADPRGNADNTIPPWTGGLTVPPVGFESGGDYINPFAGEEPLHVITTSNMQQYEEKLTEGLKALLERFPDTFRIPVYPSHRTAAFPQHVYEDIKRDAQSVELIGEGDGIRNIGAGRIPFPVPKSGVELMWNLNSKYFGDDIVVRYSSFPVQANGSYTPVKAQQWRVWAPELFDDSEFGIKVFYEMFSPSSVAGVKIVTHEPFNNLDTPRQTWTFNPGQRRVLRAPEIAYDTPVAGSDGLITNDATSCFSGAKDRYNWNLIGKKELIVPYNGYDLESLNADLKKIIGPQHVDPDYMRYELHRVWVVEAELREGKRNVFGKRRYYFDEDSYVCTGGELYDNRGELWRVLIVNNIQMYDVPMLLQRSEQHYDLQARRYMAQQFANEDGPLKIGGNNARSSDFTPAKLRRSGR